MEKQNFNYKNLLKLYKKNKFPVTILRIFQAYGPIKTIIDSFHMLSLD